MSFYDYLGIINPKKGIRRYINLPVLASFLCIIGVIASIPFINYTSIVQILIIPLLTYNVLVPAEAAFCYFSVSGDKKNITFYKTIPNMSEILKKSLMTDVIRRIANIVFTYFCCGMIVYIYYGGTDFLLLLMMRCMAMTYILAEFLIFTLRKWNNIYISIFLYMPFSCAFPPLNGLMLPFDNDTERILLSLGVLIPAVCIGIFANKYVIKKLSNCRSDLTSVAVMKRGGV